MAETDESGFTLVEMIVALALTALIALLLIQSLQATGLTARSARRLAAQEEVQLVRAHLRRTLADVVRRRRDGRRVSFLGQEGRLTALVAANREAERVSDVQVGLAAAEQAGAGLALVETLRPAHGPEGPAQPEILLDGIAGLRFRYFGAPERVEVADRRPRWEASWTRTDRLPALVEVTVAFPPSDTRRWPPLILSVGAGS